MRRVQLVLALVGTGVKGAIRIQKYAHLLARDKYDDWVRTRHYHYSHNLTLDLQYCMHANLVAKTKRGDLPTYSLTDKGQRLFKKGSVIMPDMYEKIHRLELKKLLATTHIA